MNFFNNPQKTNNIEASRSESSPISIAFIDFHTRFHLHQDIETKKTKINRESSKMNSLKVAKENTYSTAISCMPLGTDVWD